MSSKSFTHRLSHRSAEEYEAVVFLPDGTTRREKRISGKQPIQGNPDRAVPRRQWKREQLD